MSVAKPKTNTSQASTVNTTNLNVQDTDGITFAGSDSNVLNVTDGGAIAGALDFARGAFLDVSEATRDLGRAAIDSGTENLNRGLGFAESAYESSLGFGSDVIESNERVASDAISATSGLVDRLAQSHSQSLDIVAGTTGDALDKLAQSNTENLGALGNLVGKLFDFAGDAIDQASESAQDLAGQSIAGNQSLAKTTSESADDRVARIGLYGFAAIAAIFVAQAFIKR